MAPNSTFLEMKSTGTEAFLMNPTINIAQCFVDLIRKQTKNLLQINKITKALKKSNSLKKC